MDPPFLRDRWMLLIEEIRNSQIELADIDLEHMATFFEDGVSILAFFIWASGRNSRTTESKFIPHPFKFRGGRTIEV